MKKLSLFKPLWNYLKEDRLKLLIASLLIFICGISEIFTGYLNGAAIEFITNKLVVKSLIYLGIYLLLRLLVDALLRNIAESMLQKIENSLSRRLAFFTYKKTLDLPSVAFEEKSSGEIINRVTNDADSLSFCFSSLLNTVSSLVGSVIIIVYVFMNSWIVGVEILLFLGILFVLLKHYNPLLKSVHRDRKAEQDKFTSLVTESIRGVREIKTLGIKRSLINDIIEIIKNIFNKSNDEISIRRKFNALTQILKGCMEVFVFATCVILLYYNKTTLTFFVAMTYYVYRYMWLIENINGLTQTFQRVTVSLGRVNEILANKLYQDETFGNNVVTDNKGVIEFKDVSFGYPGEEITLKNFNLVLQPHKKIAIVGASGQGKSTLFNLLTRIFDPTSGTILLDGVDIRELSEESLRRNISIIRQEPFIFNRSIRDNFKLVDNDISDIDMKKYIKMAYLDGYILSLPNGYDTILGEGGVNLSGGQKQRLSIARTLARKSKVILFDEATSSLDNNSQEYIKKAIDKLVSDHTVVIVAHRLSTIMDADIIHVVDKGNVIASGNHKKLLKECKIYKKLYEGESL